MKDARAQSPPLSNLGEPQELQQLANSKLMKTRVFCALVLAIPNLMFATCVPNGLIATWQGQSNILDSIGNYDGVAKGTGVSYVNGEVGKGFQFNGTSSATVNLGTFTNFGTNDFTVEFWFKSSDNSFDELISKRDDCVNTASFFDLRMEANGTIDFNIDGADPINGYRDFTSVTAINNGVWHHVAAVRQQSNAVLYIDGAYDASQSIDTVVANITNSANLRLGNGPCVGSGDHTTWLQGALDEISIYTNALSASDILAIYQAGSSGKCCFPPRVATQPVTPQNVHTNASASFTVTALGSPAPSYQWRLNGANINAATNNIYSIATAHTNNLGTYDVIISNSCGTATSDATSVLAFAPVITSQPANATGVLGSPAYFSAVAGGSPTITYQWRKNTTNINDGATYAGTDTPNLTIKSVVGGNQGTYSVHVSNDGGSTNSANAMLSVPPQVTVQPTSKTAFVSNNVVFAVTATGSPTLTYQWMTNSANVPGATTPSYTVSSVNSNWNGLAFSVKVSNTYGTATSDNTATLSLKGTVLVDIPTPLKTTNCPGEPRVLCVTGGAAAGHTPTYQWRHNVSNITGATAPCYTVDVIDSTAAGSYSVVVSDNGSDTSSTATIVYAAPLALTANPTSQTVLLGQPVFLNANATGFAPVSFSWMKNGFPVPYTSSNYVIAGAALSDIGTYYCQLANYCGYSNSSTATITVNTTACAPNLTNGLIAWWQFESNSLDFTGNYNGTASGVTYPNGEVNLGMNFNGSTAQTNYFGTDVGTFGTNDFTVELWIATTNSSPMCVMDKRVDCDADFKGWEIHMGYDPNNHVAPGQVGFGIIAGGFANYGANASRIDDGGFHHVALVRSNVVASMYVDGTMVTNITMPVLVDITNSVPLKIGRSVCEGLGTGIQRFTGLMDEIGFYNRPLSPAEILSIYNAWGAGKCTGP
ncbi:MAG: C-terminal target protein [Verrucomicrobiales bacterium]|nr:C-terminal target protein [Verrucomicrobiales bacterium]